MLGFRFGPKTEYTQAAAYRQTSSTAFPLKPGLSVRG